MLHNMIKSIDDFLETLNTDSGFKREFADSLGNFSVQSAADLEIRGEEILDCIVQFGLNRGYEFSPDEAKEVLLSTGFPDLQDD